MLKMKSCYPNSQHSIPYYQFCHLNAHSVGSKTASTPHTETRLLVELDSHIKKQTTYAKRGIRHTNIPQVKAPRFQIWASYLVC